MYHFTTYKLILKKSHCKDIAWHTHARYQLNIFITHKVFIEDTPYLVMIQRVSPKLANSFVTANFASAGAQLSKLERQWVLPPNCGKNHEKKQLFIFPNSLTIHQTSTLQNTFYFNNTWTKIQLGSHTVNMQPDKTKCYPQRPIITLWPAASKMLNTSMGSLPMNSGTLSLHMERNWMIRKGAAGYWNVTLATTRRKACLDDLRPIFDVGKARCDGSLKFV